MLRSISFNLCLSEKTSPLKSLLSHFLRIRSVILMIVSPKTIFSLLVIEALIISFFSILISILFTQLLSLIFFPILDQQFGIYLENDFLSVKDFYFIVLVLLTSIFVALRKSGFPLSVDCATSRELSNNVCTNFTTRFVTPFEFL